MFHELINSKSKVGIETRFTNISKKLLICGYALF
jgi:hypothetical protein